MKYSNRMGSCVIAVLSVVFVGGCSGLHWEGMVPQDMTLKNRSARTVSVEVIGGWQDDAFGLVRISGENYNKALCQAIARSSVFGGIAPRERAYYHLKVTMVSMTDVVGFSPATVVTEWALTRGGDDMPCGRMTVSTSGSVARLNGLERRKLSVEAAGLANIKEGVETISCFDLE